MKNSGLDFLGRLSLLALVIPALNSATTLDAQYGALKSQGLLENEGVFSSASGEVGMPMGLANSNNKVVSSQVEIDVDFIGQIGGRALAIAGNADQIFAGLGLALLVLDASDPAQPQYLGQTGFLCGGINDIELAGTYAFVACEDHLRILDVSDPALPVEVGLFPAPRVRDVEVIGDHAYVLSLKTNFTVVDISDPRAPSFAGFLMLSDVRDVAVANGFAYVADGVSGLRIVNVEDPTNPFEVGSLEGIALSVEVSGSHAYVGSHELTVIDVSDPSAPVRVSSFPLAELAFDLEIAGSKLYIAERGTGIRILDVSSPEVPSELGFYEHGPGLDSRSLKDLEIVGDLAYAATFNKGFITVNVADSTSPFRVGHYQVGFVVEDVTLDGSRAFIPSREGFAIVNISNPAKPELLSFEELPFAGSGIVVIDETVYVPRPFSGEIVEFDISDIANPRERRRIETAGPVLDLEVVGNLAYVAAGRDGLRILDIGTIETGVEVGQFDTQGFARSLELVGNLAYVSDDFVGGLRIIDTTNPSLPIEVGFVESIGPALSVDVDGDFAYVAARDSGLRVIQIADPSNPAEVGFVRWIATDVEVSGSIAYVSGGTGLDLFDISNPSSPNLVASERLAGTTNGVAVSGSHAFVSGSLVGVAIMEISIEPPPPPPPQPPEVDLSIDDIVPIQVVEGVNINGDDRIDLVQGKPLIVRVRPGITGGKALDPADKVDVAVSFLGVIQTQEVAIGSLLSDPTTYLDFRFSPFRSGDAEVFATVDVGGDFAESDEENNSEFVPVTIKDTNGLYIFHIELIDVFQRGPEDAGNTAAEGGRFMKWVFPIANDEFRNEFSPSPFRSFQFLRGESSLNFDAWSLWRKAMRETDGQVDRVVAIVPQEYFDYHLRCPGAAGTIREGIVYVVGGEWTTAAHELGHSYGMFTTGEEYTAVEDPPGSCQGRVVDPGPLADGYNVELMEPVEDSLDFMGASLGPQRLDHWITKGNFEFLFGHEEFLVNPADPELLLVSGQINLDGSITLGPLDRLVQGIPDTDQEGDYSVGLIDVNGNEVASVSFDVSFVLHMDPYPIQPGDTGVFMLALPYHEDALTIEFQLGNEVLSSVDISTTLLHDAVASIPDAAFVKNPEQRRNATYNKIRALLSQIESGAFQGATKNLENDIISSFENWLIDDYPTADVLQYSKSEILDLAYELLARLEANK